MTSNPYQQPSGTDSPADASLPPMHWTVRNAPALGLACGLIVSVPALMLSVLSAGAGHGNYLFAKLLYPAPMGILMCGPEVAIAGVVAAVAQYPLIGLSVGYACRRGRRVAIVFAAVITTIHVIATAVVLAFGSESFS